jgi:hypothetical protein
MDENLSEPTDQEIADLMALVVSTRQRAFNQMLFGLCWWAGSSIAMYFSLTSTGSSFYWYGGALAALFHWYRAYKLISATKQAGITSLIQREKIVIGVIIVFVVFSTAKVVPEYIRITTPEIGTCWKGTNGDMLTPVACWASGEIYTTVGFGDSEGQCGTDYYLQPDATDARFTCLEKL